MTSRDIILKAFEGPATYEIIDVLGADESGSTFSIYLTISNTAEISDMTLTGINFDWPYSNLAQDLEIMLKQITFGESDIWAGDPVFNSSIKICDICVEQFSLDSDRVLGSGTMKTLRFSFYGPLLSSFNDIYNTNPYAYNVMLIFDNSCYVETLETQYYHP